jgi:hypothetical protein
MSRLKIECLRSKLAVIWQRPFLMRFCCYFFRPVIRLLSGDLSQLSNFKFRSYDNDPRHQADKDDRFALKNASALLWGLINIGDFSKRDRIKDKCLMMGQNPGMPTKKR